MRSRVLSLSAICCNALQHTALYLALSCFLFHSRAHAHSISLSLTHSRSSMFFLQRARFPPFCFIVQRCRRIRLFPTTCICYIHTATHCNTLQHTATHCNTLQHTATHCNALQHTASKLDSFICPTMAWNVMFW